MDRRDFIKHAGITLGVAAANRLTAANDRINVAVIGTNGRGHEHVAALV